MPTTTISIEYIAFTRWPREITGTPITAASDHALTVLPARLGPTATLVLHRATRTLTATGSEFTDWDTYSGIADELGVAPSVLIRAIERLIRFGYARWADTYCTILEIATIIGTDER